MRRNIGLECESTGTVLESTGTVLSDSNRQHKIESERTVPSESERTVPSDSREDMMNNRLACIRDNEEKSHTEIYLKEKLYDSDTWLKKPIKTVQGLIECFADYQELNALDLGCGVGRNSIYVVKSFQGEKCTVDCVDILPVAIEILEKNAAEHGVQDRINGVVTSIEDYRIAKDNYDLIMAVSALEHIDSKAHFFEKLREIKAGTRDEGIVCLIINSDVKEIDSATGEEFMPNFEVNLKTEVIIDFLDEEFSGWELMKRSISAQEYDIPRDGITSVNESDYICCKEMRNS